MRIRIGLVTAGAEGDAIVSVGIMFVALDALLLRVTTLISL